MGQIRGARYKLRGGGRQRGMRRRSTIDETPPASPTKISRNILEHGIMDGSRRSRELAESTDVVANITATRNVGVHEFSKKRAV